jgi:hypothetical protein
MNDINTSSVDYFLNRWTKREGGAERANYGLFLIELCERLGVARRSFREIGPLSLGAECPQIA